MENAKQQMKDAGREFLSNVLYWKMAIGRLLLYTVWAFFGAFLILTETFGDDTWDNMGWFSRCRLFIGCLNAALPPIIAFFDGTIALLRGDRGSGHTEFLRKG